jgi:hypothetical protein
MAMRGCAEEVDVVMLKKCIGGGRCVLEPSMRGCGCLSAPPRDGDDVCVCVCVCVCRNGGY